jgi:putative ATPase
MSRILNGNGTTQDLHYGEGYKYNPDYDEPVDQEYLPEGLQTKTFLDVD